MTTDDLEDLEPSEFEPDKLKVAVEAGCGGFHHVRYTTVVAIDISDKVKAQGRLRDVALLLRASLPVKELENGEKIDEELVVDKEGKVESKVGFTSTLEAQKQLRQQYGNDKNGK